MRSVGIPPERLLLKAWAALSWPSSLCSNFSQFPARYKPSCSNQSLVFFRNSRKQGVEVNDGRYGHFLCKVFDKSEGSTLKTSKCKSGSAVKFLHSNGNCSISEKSTSPTIRRGKDTIFSNLQGSILPFQNQLKFWTLCGILTLQCTQRAVAASNIASELQSMASLGDLGDISTGILADIFF